jgi:hypothetical protein
MGKTLRVIAAVLLGVGLTAAAGVQMVTADIDPHRYKFISSNPDGTSKCGGQCPIGGSCC